MPKPLEWFQERLGKTLQRTHKSNPQQRPSYWPMTDEDVIKYHKELQDNGYIYEDNR